MPLAGLEQSAGSTPQVPHLRFQFAVVRTAEPRKLAILQSQDLRLLVRSQNRCRRCCGREGQLANFVLRMVLRRESGDYMCANVHMNGTASVSNMTNFRLVRFRSDMPDDAAIDHRATLSEVPHRRQFWQSTQFLVVESALKGFRRKWHT